MARCTHSITPKDTRMEKTPPPDYTASDLIPFDTYAEEKKKDHPVWGLLIVVVCCATVLLSIQMLIDYHW